MVRSFLDWWRGATRTSAMIADEQGQQGGAGARRVAATASVVEKLTDAQLDEFRDAFASFDKDGGGSIDAAELRELMASVGECPSDDELAEMIRIADADGTGDIDFAEFVTLMAHKMDDNGSEKMLRGAFSVFDNDGNGVITGEEMCRVLTSVGEPVSLEAVNKVLSQIQSGKGFHDASTPRRAPSKAKDGADAGITYPAFCRVLREEKAYQFGQGDVSEILSVKPGLQPRMT